MVIAIYRPPLVTLKKGDSTTRANPDFYRLLCTLSQRRQSGGGSVLRKVARILFLGISFDPIRLVISCLMSQFSSGKFGVSQQRYDQVTIFRTDCHENSSAHMENAPLLLVSRNLQVPNGLVFTNFQWVTFHVDEKSACRTPASQSTAGIHVSA